MWEERAHLDLNQVSLEKLLLNYLKFEGGEYCQIWMQSYDTSTRGNPLTSQFRPFPRFYVTDSEYRGGGIKFPTSN